MIFFGKIFRLNLCLKLLDNQNIVGKILVEKSTLKKKITQRIIMRVAVPVWDESLKIFKNAGHTPFFAVFDVSGGMFKSCNFVEIRQNPRVKEDHEHECESQLTGKCSHEGQSEEERLEHKEGHRIMAQIINDCSFLIADKCCKNTKLTMNDAGINVVSIHGEEFAKNAIAKAKI